MLVQRDHQNAPGEVQHAGLLGGVQGHEVGVEERLALDQVVLREVAVALHVLVGRVARVLVLQCQGGAAPVWGFEAVNPPNRVRRTRSHNRRSAFDLTQ